MRHINKIIVLVVLLASIHFGAQAQKYAVVNTDYVLKSIPDYATAQKRLDKYVSDWQKEMADIESEIATMRTEYEQESYLLPESLKKRRLEELRAKEQELRELQQKRFGPDGDLDKRRAELIGPVQERVYNTIERIAHEKNLAFVFDKAGSATVLFASKKYDISDDVLELMGYKPGTATEPQAEEKGSDKARRSTPKNDEMRLPGGKRDVATPLGTPQRK